jgi:AefR-like transcriptional repressor, C-terminal domain
MSASMFAEPDLLAAHRADMADASAGPHRPVTAVAEHLRAEQGRGRISAAADCSAAADLLIGACFQYAFLCCFAGRQPTQAKIDVQAASVVGTLLAGIAAGRVP